MLFAVQIGRRSFYMTEEQIKMFCKNIIEYGNRPFTRSEKEVIKQAIDDSETADELLSVIVAILINDKQRYQQCGIQ